MIIELTWNIKNYIDQYIRIKSLIIGANLYLSTKMYNKQIYIFTKIYNVKINIEDIRYTRHYLEKLSKYEKKLNEKLENHRLLFRCNDFRNKCLNSIEWINWPYVVEIVSSSNTSSSSSIAFGEIYLDIQSKV